MAGFLDATAPTVAAEYGRYLDGDLLGKFVFKNFMQNRVRTSPRDLRIPLGRFGDVGTTWNCCADAQVASGGRWIDVEIKCARVNIANRSKGGMSENWAYNKILETSTGERKRFDIAVFVAIRNLGVEDPKYWQYLKDLEQKYCDSKIMFRQNALPHEEDFLSICSFIIMPRSRVPDNYFRIALSAMPNSSYADYQAWGYDPLRCCSIWKSAMNALRGRPE